MTRLFIRFKLFFFLIGLWPFTALSLAQEAVTHDEQDVVMPSGAEPAQDLHNLDVVKDLLTNMINPFLSKLPPEPVEPEIVEPSNLPPEEKIILPDFPVNQNYPGSEQPYSGKTNPEPVPVETLPVLIDPPVIELVGIIYDTNHPQALFNNRIVSIGDEIEGIKVVDISKSGIMVEFKGMPFAYGMDDRKVNQ
jgi:hypothetical protein